MNSRISEEAGRLAHDTAKPTRPVRSSLQEAFEHRMRSLRQWATTLATVGALLAMPVFVSVPPSQAAEGDIGYQDQAYNGSGGAPTADKPQSKLWFNDGSWWADIFDAVSKTYHVFRLDRSTEKWVDTGTQIDSRPSTRADMLWSGGHLYAASAVKASSSTTNVDGQPARLFRYSYSPTSRSYSLDAGFPVAINNVSSESITLDRDSRGILWATWTQGQKVYVNSTFGDDASWGAPFVLPAPGTSILTADDISAVAAFGKNRVGLMWSNQSDSTMYFATHRDGDDRTTWTGQVAASDPKFADDHLNLKQLEGDDLGHLYAAVKTSYDETGVSTAPQVELLALNPNSGKWETHVFGTVADCHTRPMLIIDSTNRVLHMFATAPSSGGCPYSGSPGSIYEKTAPLNDPSFAAGRGTPVIRDHASPYLNDVTGTKQNATSASGLVVLASNDGTSRYWHADIPLAQPAPTASFTASPTSGVAPLQVTFTDTSPNNPTGWSWTFGDGGASTAQNPVHTFNDPGTYTVTLTTTNSNGTSASSTGAVTVAAPATSTAYSSAVLADGPAGYWRLGETSGTGVADATGAPSGTAVGGVTPGLAGVSGDGDTAMGFDGSSGYIRVDDRSSLDFSSQDFSVEAWARPTASGAVVHKGDASGYTGWQYRLALTSAGKWRGTVFVGSNNVTVTDPGTPSMTSWTHLVLVRAAGQVTLYVNGAAVATTKFTGNVNTGTGVLAIGRTGSSAEGYFKGGVDEVAIYPTALSAAQVANHYTAASGR
jgi:PKD repeat protein